MTPSPNGLTEQVEIDNEPPIITLRAAAKDIAIGSIAGMVSEVFEYPFDLAKVRLQSQLLTASSSSTLRFNGPVDCLKQTFRDEGIRGLYRGLPVPIVGTMAETAALFFAYTSFQNVIRRYTPWSTDHDPSRKLSTSQFALAGACAGSTASFILTPIELIKCKMQVQMMASAASSPSPSLSSSTSPSLFSRVPSSSSPGFSSPSSSSQPILASPPRNIRSHSSTAKYPGPISLLRSTIRAHGVSGLWLGHTGTLLREAGGNAAWFAVKETIAAALIRRRLRKSSLSSSSSSSGSFAVPSSPKPPRPPLKRSSRANAEILPWESAVSGAIAGACGTVVSYPADTVKSAMQTSEEIRAARPPPPPPLSSSTSSTGSSLSARNSNSGGLGGNAGSGGFIATFKRMYAAHGVRGMYAGCGMTAAKAIPISGIMFVVYDGLSSLVDRYGVF